MSNATIAQDQIAGMHEYANALERNLSFEELATIEVGAREISEQLSLGGLRRVWGYLALPNGMNLDITRAIRREAPHRHWLGLKNGLLVPGPMIIQSEEMPVIYPGIALYQQEG